MARGAGPHSFSAIPLIDPQAWAPYLACFSRDMDTQGWWKGKRHSGFVEGLEFLLEHLLDASQGLPGSLFVLN